MSYRLKNSRVVPPEGFKYKEPLTGKDFNIASLSETVKEVLEHRVGNNLPRSTEAEVQEDVEDQICKRVGYEWCRNMAAGTWGFNLDWDSIKAGTRTLATQAVNVLQGKEPWCPQEEAERRAAICVKCFANQRGGGCLSCGFMDLVRGVISQTCDSVRTVSDDRLNSCAVCSCLLKCKVHYPSSVLKSSMSDKQKSAYSDVPDCWMNSL